MDILKQWRKFATLSFLTLLTFVAPGFFSHSDPSDGQEKITGGFKVSRSPLFEEASFGTPRAHADFSASPPPPPPASDGSIVSSCGGSTSDAGSGCSSE